MEKLEIKMLGRFAINLNGRDLLRELEGSKKKTALIQFLILNTDKDVSNLDLFYTLWPNEENINPESSLKTLVSRMRTTLASLGLKNAILTKRGVYKWNTQLSGKIDVFEADKLYSQLKNAKALSGGMKEKFESFLRLYDGDLLTGCDGEGWLIPKRSYYHNIYVETVNRYIDMLKNSEEYDEILHVARAGLEIDALDTTFNMQMMNALVELGKENEAFAQYNYTTGLQRTYLGEDSSEEILSFYKRLTDIDSSVDTCMDNILSELKKDDDDEDGAFICDYTIFKDIYKINVNNLKRMGITMFLGLVSIESIDAAKPDMLLMDKTMKMLGETLRTNLRRGDTVSRYSASQYAVLLPSSNLENGKIALERVKKSFYSHYLTPEFIINHKLKPIN